MKKECKTCQHRTATKCESCGREFSRYELTADMLDQVLVGAIDYRTPLDIRCACGGILSPKITHNMTGKITEVVIHD